MGYKVKQVADLVGISVRTLHHYDQIGLLQPETTTESGYRLYTDEDIALLQQILFFKQLGFPLKQIQTIIHSSSYNQLEALHIQQKMLQEERNRIDEMIRTIGQTIKHMKGEIHMSNEEKFKGFNFNENPYEKEARERWGDEAVDAANQKVGQLSDGEKNEFAKQWDALYQKLAAIRYEDPASQEAQQAIGEWYDLLNRIGDYSLDAFKGLGQMYVYDERFTKNIDQYGEGLAKFMSEAMAVYADSRKR